MNSNHKDYTFFNVMPIGETRVRKTCIINPFVKKYGPNFNLSTIGVVFENKKVE